MSDDQSATSNLGAVDLRGTLGGVRVARDVVHLTGPDAASFLQGQVSQDVEGLAVGESAMSLVLQPKGKVDAWVRISRTAETDFTIDVDAGHGTALHTRLSRFKLRVDCVLSDVETWQTLALRGPGAAAAADELVTADDAGSMVAAVDWPGVEAVDVLGKDVDCPASVPEGTTAALEALRIESGVPAMGRELTESTIPAEAVDIEGSVSFTKGCYVGQELVVRIHSRGGQVPRPVRGLTIDGDVTPPVGSSIIVDGAVVGEVTSASVSPSLGVVALATVSRTIEPDTSVTIQWPDDGPSLAADAVVAALPLID